MNFWKSILIVPVLLIAASGIRASDYRMYEIGRPEGENPGSCSVDINNSGTVLCNWIKNGTTDFGGLAVWTKATGAVEITVFRVIDYPGGINDRNQVAGSRSGGSSAIGVVRETDGSIRELDMLPGAVVAWASRINDAGMAIGEIDIHDQATDAYYYIAARWDCAGNTSTIAVFGSATAINASGLVAFTNSAAQACVWDGCATTILNPLSPGDRCWTQGMNDAGQVVGQSGSHAVLWNVDGSPVDLGIGVAYDINNRGQIVGVLEHSGCTVWDADLSRIYLNDYSNGAQSDACAINDSGQVAGTIYRDGFTPEAVMWEPIPEPSSMFALTLGFAGLTRCLRRRRK